jgi:uncharacterized protein (TIGR02453 family)
VSAFLGWPPEALTFLEELGETNEREWFHANRARYEEHLADPTRALGEALSDFGRAKVFRPFNDVRFHGGPPIKEHVALALGYEGAGGAYVQLSLDGLLVASGLYDPARDQLDRLRRGIDDSRTAAPLTRALNAAAAAGLELGQPDLKRAPRGYPVDHTRIELLRYRRMTVHRVDALAPWLHGPEALGRIRGVLEAAAPLVAWLREHVGPTQLTRTR